jgi:hypothetical protein
MGKRKSRSCLTKIGIAIGVVSLVLVIIWLGFLWMMEVHIDHQPR